jgi:hypothetical protein
VHELYGRINYKAFLVREGRRPDPHELKWGDLQEVMLLLKALDPAAMTDHHHFEQLASDLKRTIDLIDTADLKFLIDERIFELHQEMVKARGRPSAARMQQART